MDPELYRQLVLNEIGDSGLDPEMVMNIIKTESGGNPRAVSGKGAQGLMQLMPENVSKYGVTDPFDPAQSIRGGVALLKDLQKTYGKDTARMLVDYNGGPKAVEAYNAGKPWQDSTDYLNKVQPGPSLDDVHAFLAGQHGKTGEPDLKDVNTFLVSNKPTAEKGMLEKAADTVKSLGTGAVKSVKGTAADLAALAQNAGTPEFLGPAAPIVRLLQESVSPESVAALKKSSEPVGTAEKIGKGVTDAAQFAIPSVGLDEGVLRLGAKVLPSVINNAAARAAVNAGELGVRMAAQGGLGAAEAKVRGQNPKVGAAVAATGPILGAMGEGSPEVAKEIARAAIRQALKVPVVVLRNSAKAMGATLPAKLESVVDTVLGGETGGKYVTSPEGAETAIQGKEALLDQPVDAATAAGVPTDAPQRAQAALQAAQNTVAGAADPRARMAALQAKADALATSGGSHSMPGPPVVTMQPGPILGPNGQAIMTPVSTPGPNVLRPFMTPRATLDSARRANTKWGVGTDPAVMDAEKIVESSERDALKHAVPETEPILASQGKLIVTKNALDRAALREANRDVFNITTAAALSGNPIIAAGHQVMKMSGIKGGVMFDMLGKMLERNDVRGVATALRSMGYGGLLDALPQQQHLGGDQ